MILSVDFGKQSYTFGSILFFVLMLTGLLMIFKFFCSSVLWFPGVLNPPRIFFMNYADYELWTIDVGRLPYQAAGENSAPESLPTQERKKELLNY